MAKRAVVFLPAVAILGLLAYGFSRDPREIRSPLLGGPATPFTLALFDGGRFTWPTPGGRS